MLCSANAGTGLESAWNLGGTGRAGVGVLAPRPLTKMQAEVIYSGMTAGRGKKNKTHGRELRLISGPAAGSHR